MHKAISVLLQGNKQCNISYRECKICKTTLTHGDRGGTVVKVLCYKSEGRWLDPDGVIGIFH